MRVIAAALLIFSASNSFAAGFKGTELNEMCASENKGMKNICNMWISGFQAGIAAGRSAAKTDFSVCLPDGFTGNQATLIIEKFMKDNPATLHNPAEVVAFYALSREFPCKSPNSN